MAALVGEYSQNNLLLDAATGLYQIGDLSGAGNGIMLDLQDSSRQAILGEVNALFNNTKITVNDQNKSIKADDIDGDLLVLDRSTLLYSIGDISGAGNGTKLVLNDTTEVATVSAVNGLYIEGSAQLIGSNTALANGAAAAAGTLLNAPLAGNPTKWIPIDDNGVIRHVPAW